MTVCATAWESARPAAGTEARSLGSCARCGADDAARSVTEAVSRQFTGMDRWVQPGGRYLCEVCSWVYTHEPLRMLAHVIRRRPRSMESLSWREVGELLEAPLESEVAVTVPLRPGRKHLVSEAQWQMVTLDDVQVQWGLVEAERFRLLRYLIGLGFSGCQIAAAAPSFQVLSKLDRALWPLVMQSWSKLDPWRPTTPWLDLGIKVTRGPR